MSVYIAIYCTYKDEAQAKTISRALLEARLVACANIVHGQSLYWWKNEIQDETEVYVLYKSTKDQFDKIEAMVKDMHSYEVPCIVAWDIVEGSPEYLRWITTEAP